MITKARASPAKAAKQRRLLHPHIDLDLDLDLELDLVPCQQV